MAQWVPWPNRQLSRQSWPYLGPRDLGGNPGEVGVSWEVVKGVRSPGSLPVQRLMAAAKLTVYLRDTSLGSSVAEELVQLRGNGESRGTEGECGTAQLAPDLRHQALRNPFLPRPQTELQANSFHCKLNFQYSKCSASGYTMHLSSIVSWRYTELYDHRLSQGEIINTNK